MTLAQQLGADAEAKILQQRLDVLEDYKSKYLATMKEITNLENTPSDKLNGYNTPKDTNTTNGNSGSGGSSSSAPSLNKGSYVSVKPGTNGIQILMVVAIVVQHVLELLNISIMVEAIHITLMV